VDLRKENKMTVYELIQELAQCDADYTVKFEVKDIENISVKCGNCNEITEANIDTYDCDFNSIHYSNVFKEATIELN
jgi:phage FluMu protein Com